MKKNRNSSAARRQRRINRLVAQEVLKQTALGQCAEINRQAIEMKIRKDLSQAVKQRKQYEDPIKCRRLYVLPGLTAAQADNYMRNSQYRVCEQDGLRLY